MKHLVLLIAMLFIFGTNPIEANPYPQRKKVGLVLSGGGAKGMAHIGALKVIEEAGIPIDYVVGTSMGSIIGGLYSIGYTPEQMDSMVRKQDWAFLLSDKIPRSEMNLMERESDEKYVISVPFSKSSIKEVAGGVIKGQNIANLFSELTLGYHNKIDFNKLPTPFACVSEDLVTGEEYVFHKGVLATAMRASMAIPGVFTPVRLDSMVLIDGGVTNNYPVNIARQMGADVIIGHHPHVIQPVEWLEGQQGNKTLCIYSLGDLIAVMTRASNMLGGLVTFDIVQENDEFRIENPIFNPTVFHFGPSYYNGKIYFLSDFTSDLAATFGNVYGITADYDDLVAIVKDTIDEEFLPEYLKSVE